MTAALNLPEAAGAAFDNLQLKWVSDNLKSSMTIFASNVKFIGSEAEVNTHPIRNWFALISSLATQLGVSDVPIGDLTVSAEYVYRICWVTQQLRDQNLITINQATDMLTAYNIAFTV